MRTGVKQLRGARSATHNDTQRRNTELRFIVVMRIWVAQNATPYPMVSELEEKGHLVSLFNLEGIPTAEIPHQTENNAFA